MQTATFSDELVQYTDPETRSESIRFAHSLRCEIRVTITETKENNVGWKINMHGNPRIIEAFKREVFYHTVEYLERRLRKKVNRISYNDIEKLANAQIIRTVSRF